MKHKFTVVYLIIIPPSLITFEIFPITFSYSKRPQWWIFKLIDFYVPLELKLFIDVFIM